MANPADRAAPWVDLPPELTANILQRLSAVDIFHSAQVCSAWRRICEDPSMWRYVELWNPAGKEREAKQLRHLGKHCCAISKKGIEAAGRSCPFLNSFNFFMVSENVNRPYDGEAIAIAENMRGLKHLRLYGNKMTDKGVEAILDACPRLQSLNLEHCKYATLRGELGMEEMLSTD
nr:F-box protein SKIP19-like [Ipomoea batatas]